MSSSPAVTCTADVLNGLNPESAAPVFGLIAW
jgi:hypothetical protein